MDLEGMTGENAEPYFTREDISPAVTASRASSLSLLKTVKFSAVWHHFQSPLETLVSRLGNMLIMHKVYCNVIGSLSYCK